MKLLIDTDAFSKLAICGLLESAVNELGGNLTTCGRLAALPYMLQRGKLPKNYGIQTCCTLERIANRMPVVQSTNGSLLDQFLQINEIDAGEALLFAQSIEEELPLITGDKRALLALKNVKGIAALLNNRIVTLEAILLALCNTYSATTIHSNITPHVSIDKVFRICFPTSTIDPTPCLHSYYSDISNAVLPIHLWEPIALEEPDEF